MLAKKYFEFLDRHVGPFDRPIQFRPFPFDAGGAVNLLTVGAGRHEFVTYVSWDLFGHAEQKIGCIGRYELLAICDDEQWCLEMLTNIGRFGLQATLNPGDTLDIGPWVKASSPLQGVVLEQNFSTEIDGEKCGLLKCIGVSRSELEFADAHGVSALVEHLKRQLVYPNTIVNRGSVSLT